MGVNHGEDRGDTSPQNLERGDANTNSPPPQILSYRYKNERSEGLQNTPKSRFRPRWGSSRRSPRPLSRLERGHPSPYATPLDTDPPSALAMRPSPEVQPDLRLWWCAKCEICLCHVLCIVCDRWHYVTDTATGRTAADAVVVVVVVVVELARATHWWHELVVSVMRL